MYGFFTTELTAFDLEPFGPELTTEGLRPKEDHRVRILANPILRNNYQLNLTSVISLRSELRVEDCVLCGKIVKQLCLSTGAGDDGEKQESEIRIIIP